MTALNLLNRKNSKKLNLLTINKILILKENGRQKKLILCRKKTDFIA